MKTQNIFDNIPAKAKDEIFETLVQNKNVKIERIISTGQKSPENFWYDQDEDEFVLILQGSAILEFENKETVEMEAGDWLLIPAHKKHRVESTNEKIPTVWLTVFVS